VPEPPPMWQRDRVETRGIARFDGRHAIMCGRRVTHARMSFEQIENGLSVHAS